GCEAYLVLGSRALWMHLRTAEEIANLIRVDLAVFEHLGITRRDAPCNFARNRADLTLELANASFARVFADDRHDRVIGERDLLVAQSRFLELTRDQVFLRDLRLFALGVARELDDFHAVEQWSWDVLNKVRRRDEQHFTQIERNAEVVIGEVVVLRGVEHLEQCARRIPLERNAKL